MLQVESIATNMATHNEQNDEQKAKKKIHIAKWHIHSIEMPMYIDQLKLETVSHSIAINVSLDFIFWLRQSNTDCQ